MRCYIDYGTGVGNEWVEVDDLDEAKAIADEGASYTQCSITIFDEDMDELCTRRWVGVPCGPDDDDEDPISFGAFGHFADWQ